MLLLNPTPRMLALMTKAPILHLKSTVNKSKDLELKLSSHLFRPHISVLYGHCCLGCDESRRNLDLCCGWEGDCGRMVLENFGV